jgi:Beta-lactamase
MHTPLAAPLQMSLRGARRFIAALALLGVFALAGARPACAEDDNENSAPTEWWTYARQSVSDIVNTIKARNARIINIEASNSSFTSYTVTYVKNTGAYAKQWWWYVGIDANALSANLAANNARLISLKAYDVGGGNIRFAVAMIANTGVDAKMWWYYFGQTPSEIETHSRENGARLASLQSYYSNGQTYYSAIMIANVGADEKAWWWYYNVSSKVIGDAVASHGARLLDVTPASDGNFNAVIESCSSGCAAWWWRHGLSANGVTAAARDNGARVMTAAAYQACDGSPCYVAAMIANTPADVTACDPEGCVSEAKFATKICGALANRVVGYACLVGEMRPIFGGLARTNANPPSAPMTPSSVTNIASLSKTLTAIAVLQLLARNGLTIDAKFWPYLYPDWKRGPNVEQLTFKELLTHASGFAQTSQSACGDAIAYSALEKLVADGVSQSAIGAPSYGNCNFALLRELMPALQGRSLMNYANGPQRAQESSLLYIDYVNTNVLQPVGIPFSHCKPPLGAGEILSYPSPARSPTGVNWGDWSLQCGSGGWALSANDVFAVLNNLARENVLLSGAAKREMFANCLGWDCAVRSDCPNPYVCKNGDLNNGEGAAVWIYGGVFKCDVPVVVVVNSPLPPPYQASGDIIALVAQAYKEASVPGAPQACP